MRSALVLAFAIVVGVPAQPGAATSFPRPPELEHQIRFWRSVFTVYSQDQVVIHDTVDLDKIYSVLDFRGYADQGWRSIEIEQVRKDSTDAELARIRALLLRLQDGTPRDALTQDDRRIYDLFRNDPDPYKFQRAADDKRLRAQRGIREKFINGFRTSRQYLPEMERIFREEGVPVEITRLPLIESCFDISAYSKVGAAGVWQFMPATGRIYMEVGNSIDERRDPIASTRAAARYLARSYERLGSWPLAITSYNHGPVGMSRAVDATGSTDIVSMIRYYDGPGWGFASRNFYAEFLAALDIDRNPDAYFGRLPQEAVPATRTVTLDRPIDIFTAAQLARTDRYAIADMNPALLDPVVSGRVSIPAGYVLRLPADSTDGFQDRLARYVPDTRIARAAPADPQDRAASDQRDDRPDTPAAATHRVKPGQTLTGIAERYGVSVQALRLANRLGPRDQVRSGQVLRIPAS
jgi:membrane-bound lytic murein transglycosylase D